MRLTALALLAALLGAAQSDQKIERLRDVRKIFVAPLGQGAGANELRERIINKLVESKRLEVVEEPDAADAILTGIASIENESDLDVNINRRGGIFGPGKRVDASIVVRLVTKEKRILWSGQAGTGAWTLRTSPAGVSNRVAGKVVSELVKAMGKEEKGGR